MDIGKPVSKFAWDSVSNPLAQMVLRSVNLSVWKTVRDNIWDSLIKVSGVWR